MKLMIKNTKFSEYLAKQSSQLELKLLLFVKFRNLILKIPITMKLLNISI